MGLIVADSIGGMFPILAIAWLLRRIIRMPATNLGVALGSVVVAGGIGFMIRSFMDGENSFSERIARIAMAAELPGMLGATVVALVATLIWWVLKGSAQSNA